MNCPYGTRRTNHVQMTDESADRVGAIRESPLRTIMLRISILVLCLTTLVGVIHVGAIHELPLPSPTLLLQDRHGNFLAEVSSDEARGHGYWPIDQLPPRVVAATLAIEDRRFWSHPGVDPLAIGRALWQNLHSDGIVSGASTLAMQL
ncbi:MAG: penicillin-binding protein 1C, partial [Halothiobacillaceae bacterium]